MATLHDALALVLDALERNDIVGARSICEQIQLAVPDHPDNLHLLATIAERQGEVWLGKSRRRQAIADACAQRADVFRAMGATNDARAMYVEALKVDTYNAAAC